MKRITTLLLLLALMLITQQTNAQYSSAKDGIAFRYTGANYLLPVTNDWDFNDFGGGLEFEYLRHLSPAFNLGVPLKIYKAYLPTNDQGAFRDEGAMSLDLLLQMKYFRPSNFIYPYLFAGLGGNLEALRDINFSIPLGVGLNFRLQQHTYLSLKGEYRVGLEDLRDNVQLGAGLLLLLGESNEEPPLPKDTDGDGVPDENDLCPQGAGPSGNEWLPGCRRRWGAKR